MKTLAIIFAFFLAFLLIEMRNALPTNGLEDSKRGQIVSRGHLPIFREARANLRQQTTSNTEDMSGLNAGARYVTTLFHGIVSRETNLRKFPKVLSKAQVGSIMKGVDEGFISKRNRRSSFQSQEGLASHPHSSSWSLSVTSFASPKPSSLTEPTPTTKAIKSSVIKSSPVSSDAVTSYASITRSITSHTSINPLLSSQAISSGSISASPNSLLLMSSALTNRTHPASTTSSYVSTTSLSATRISPLMSPSYMSSSSTTHSSQVKPTHSSIAPLLLTSPTRQSSSASVSLSVPPPDDSPNKSLRPKTRQEKKRPFPYWSIAVSGIGCIFVIMAAYLIWKLRRQTHGDTQGPLPDLPQGEDNPVYDGDEMPLPQLTTS